LENEIKNEWPILFSGKMVRAILDGRKIQTRRVIKKQPENGESIDGCHWGNTGWAFWKNGGCTCVSTSMPPGFTGDRLWVRETWADVNSEMGPSIAYKEDCSLIGWEDFSKEFGPDYGAGPSMNYEKYPGNYTMWCSDLFNNEPGHGWRSSIHMPRWASRINLEITNVRVERVQNISEEDCRSEGILGFTKDQKVWKYWPCDPVDGPMKNTWVALPRTPKKAFEYLWDSINEKRGGFGWSENPWVWVIEFRKK